MRITMWWVRSNARTNNGPTRSLSVLSSVAVVVVFPKKKKREGQRICFCSIGCPSCNKIALHVSSEFWWAVAGLEWCRAEGCLSYSFVSMGRFLLNCSAQWVKTWNVNKISTGTVVNNVINVLKITQIIEGPLSIRKELGWMRGFSLKILKWF